MTCVIAHRGASRAHPQNTVEAFRAAVAVGADAVELDVRPTGDDQLVVHHDPALVAGRPITALRRSQLPTAVPTLDEALDACADIWVNVEIKADVLDDDGWVGAARLERFVDAVVGAVEARGDTDRVLFSSFAGDVIDRCRRTGAAGVRTALLCHALTAAAIESCVERGHEAVHPFVEGLGGDDIRRAQAAGLRVNAWTCNEPARMDELVAWGVDGICTDVPDVLVARLARHTAAD